MTPKQMKTIDEMYANGVSFAKISKTVKVHYYTLKEYLPENTYDKKLKIANDLGCKCISDAFDKIGINKFNQLYKQL